MIRRRPVRNSHWEGKQALVYGAVSAMSKRSQVLDGISLIPEKLAG